MSFLLRFIFFFISFFFCVSFLSAAILDTIRHLEAVSVVSFKNAPSQRPIQSLYQKDLERMNSVQLSDALKQFSGLIIKDFGGIGGLKTVSARSLGAQHTSLIYDGLLWSDAQNGAIDFSKIPTEYLQQITLAQGQSNSLFMPARNFSLANTVGVISQKPIFLSKDYNLNLGFKIGSFGFINPTMYLAKKINAKTICNLMLNYQQSDGKYLFMQDNGAFSKKLYRENSDIKALIVETNYYYQISNYQNLDLKLYAYNSDRGLPGAVIFYSETGKERLIDRMYHSQMVHSINYTPQWKQKVGLKYQYSLQDYNDPNWLGTVGLQNIYLQKELYATVVQGVNITKNWECSGAFDYIHNYLDANLKDFVYPTRQTLLENIAIQYYQPKFDFSTNLLVLNTLESTKTGNPSNNKQKLSPAIFAAFRPLGNEDISIRAFFKESYRLPTFNDLYYTLVGNRNLLPETVQQYNLGFSFLKCTLKDYIMGSIDVYKNYVSNKIVAYPSQSLFAWTMLNVDKVEITGLDASLKGYIALTSNWNSVARVNYTYQKSLDVSNSDSQSYKNQIAYTPIHSGSGTFSLERERFDISYQMVWSGWRYSGNQNIDANYMKGYGDHNISIRTYAVTHNTKINIIGELLNFTDNQYEIVRNYPMPGRSFRIKLQIKL